MTTTTTYLDDLGRVRVEFTGAPAAADYALVERSTDGITWTTVRGGDKVGLTAGAGKLDDYEFTAGVANTYRVSYVDLASSAGVAVGAAATGNNTSVTPPLPAGALPGDLLMILASIRNSGAGTVNVPAGWTLMFSAGNLALLGRRYVSGDTAPLVTFSGGAANADTMAQMALWRNTELVPVSSVNQLNASAQNVAWPALTLPASVQCVLQLMWKQDDLTSVATPAGANPVGTVFSTAGDDASMYWSAAFTPTSPAAAGSFVVTGGAAAISRGAQVALRRADFVTRDTSVITPVLDTVWLKNVRRPSLNRKVTVSGISEITNPARVAIIDVIGRTYPIAINDVRGSRRLSITITTPSLADAADFANALMTGHTVFLQAPEQECAVPTMYAAVGDTVQRKTSARGVRRYFDLPLTEVAAPASTIYSDTFTYADVLATYATIADVVAANVSYSALVDKISTAVVIVP